MAVKLTYAIWIPTALLTRQRRKTFIEALQKMCRYSKDDNRPLPIGENKK